MREDTPFSLLLVVHGYGLAQFFASSFLISKILDGCDTQLQLFTFQVVLLIATVPGCLIYIKMIVSDCSFSWRRNLRLFSWLELFVSVTVALNYYIQSFN